MSLLQGKGDEEMGKAMEEIGAQIDLA